MNSNANSDLNRKHNSNVPLSSDVAPKPPKPTTKAERRALQESQRAAKTAKRTPQTPNATGVPSTNTAKEPSVTIPNTDEKVNLPFIHLRTFSTVMSAKKLERPHKHVHESFRAFGERLAHDEVGSSNEKCKEFLNAISQLIDDFKTPPVEDFPRAFLRNFENHIEFLDVCRPLSITMLNCSVYVKALLAQVINFDEYRARQVISDSVKTYCNERLYGAQKAILECLRNPSSALFNDGDTVLIIGGSSSAFEAIKYLVCNGAQINLIMCHDEPIAESTLEFLENNDQPCLHIPLSDVVYFTEQIDKVLISAVVLFANGCAITASGCAQVMECLHRRGIGCILMCETYKIVDDALVNSLDNNEIFDLHHMFPLTANTNQLSYIRLRYDLLDAKYISYLVCEKGVFSPLCAFSLQRQKLPDFIIVQ